MKKRILLLMILIAGQLFAQTFNDVLRLSFQPYKIGARALGMGGAFTAVSDDYTATAYNPAGLFQLRRMEFHGGINYLSYNNNTLFFGNESFMSNSSIRLTDLGFVFPFPVIRGSLVFAFGYNRNNFFNDAMSFEGYNNGNTSMIQALLGKGDISYLLYLTDETGENTPINGRLYQSGSTINSGTESNLVFSGAIEVAKDLSVGVTIGVIGGEFEKNREYSEIDKYNIYDATIRTDTADPRTADFESFNFQETLKWELTGFSAKLGLMYRFKDFLRYGLTLKFPTINTVKEQYIVDGYSRFGTGFSTDIDPPLQSKLEYDIWSPFEFSAGFSVSRFGLTISGDVNLIDYTQMEIKGLYPSKTSKINRDIKQLFRSVIDYSIGVEYNLMKTGLRFRAGYFTKLSPFKDDPKSYDRKYFTFGIGYITPEGFALDFAYVNGRWKNHGDNYGSGDSRTFQTLKTVDYLFTTSFRF